MLLATRCPACRAPGPAPCRRCLAELRPAPALPPPPGVDACLALVAYEGAGRALVTGLKYGGNRAAVAGLGAALATLLPPGGGVVTWAPTTPRRRRARGFDQSAALARAVAAAARLPCRRLLDRPGGRPQTGRTLAERWAGPAFVPTRAARRVLARSGPAGTTRPAGATRPAGTTRVVLVDDVVTTGATVAVAAGALRSIGAERVVVLTLARTPLKARPVPAEA